MTAGGSTIDYEALAQDAMRGVVRTVLSRTAKNGLPGDHHFYVSFDTEAPGVAMSKRLREKYPHEMTIVLQHRFWDLQVSEDRFEVKLTFDGIPERLVVPFAAIKVFFDPSVRYGLQFEDPTAEQGSAALHNLNEADPEGDMPRATTTRSASPRKPRAAKKPRSDKDPVAPTLTSIGAPNVPPPQPPVPAPARPAPAAPAANGQSKDDAAQNAAEKPAAGAQIVSLDQFRKK